MINVLWALTVVRIICKEFGIQSGEQSLPSGSSPSDGTDKHRHRSICRMREGKEHSNRTGSSFVLEEGIVCEGIKPQGKLLWDEDWAVF